MRGTFHTRKGRHSRRVLLRGSQYAERSAEPLLRKHYIVITLVPSMSPSSDSSI